MNIYIAAPLFNPVELERNKRMKALVESWGYTTYLPQEDGGVSFNLIEKGADADKTRAQVFAGDTDAVRHCDALVCVLDGRVPDEGVCVELGIAYALGKPCVGYQTDQRSLDKFGNNLMIEGCLRGIARSESDLKYLLSTLR